MLALQLYKPELSKYSIEDLSLNAERLFEAVYRFQQLAARVRFGEAFGEFNIDFRVDITV
jgi:hypothetical protein